MVEGHRMTEFTVLEGPPDALPVSAFVWCPTGESWQRSEFTTMQEWSDLRYFEVPCPECGEVLPLDTKPIHDDLMDIARRARDLEEDD